MGLVKALKKGLICGFLNWLLHLAKSARESQGCMTWHEEDAVEDEVLA